MRRTLARGVANAVEQRQEEDLNCVLLAGFIAGALLSAVRIDGEPVGITVEPVMVAGLATSVIRVAVPGVFKSEYFLTITQGGEVT